MPALIQSERPHNQARGVIVFLSVSLIAAIVGFKILAVQPKRTFQTSLACKSLELPILFTVVIPQGTRVLSLQNYVGSAKGVDAGFFGSRSKEQNGLADSTFGLVKSNNTRPTILLKTLESAGGILELILPASAELNIESPTNNSLNLIIDTKNAGPKIYWQVNGGLQLDTTNLKMVVHGIATDQQPNTLIIRSLDRVTEFTLEASEPNPHAFVGLAPGTTVKFQPTLSTSPVGLTAKECKVDFLTFGPSINVAVPEPITDVTIHEMILKTFELGFTEDKKPTFAINLTGETGNLSVGGENRNPSRWDEIRSTSLTNQSLLGLATLIGVFVFGKLLDTVTKPWLERLLWGSKAANGSVSDKANPSAPGDTQSLEVHSGEESLDGNAKDKEVDKANGATLEEQEPDDEQANEPNVSVGNKQNHEPKSNERGDT